MILRIEKNLNSFYVIKLKLFLTHTSTAAGAGDSAVNKDPVLGAFNTSEYISKFKNGNNKFCKTSLLLANSLMPKICLKIQVSVF